MYHIGAQLTLSVCSLALRSTIPIDEFANRPGSGKGANLAEMGAMNLRKHAFDGGAQLPRRVVNRNHYTDSWRKLGHSQKAKAVLNKCYVYISIGGG